MKEEVYEIRRPDGTVLQRHTLPQGRPLYWSPGEELLTEQEFEVFHNNKLIAAFSGEWVRSWVITERRK